MGAEVININDRAVPGLLTDPEIWTAEANSRYSKKWKNKRTKWSVLLGRLQNPERTQETQTEFMRMTKDQQDRIKDIGGFVGGTLKDGRRLLQNAGLRYLVTFDMDFAPQGFVEQMDLDAPYAWAVYSTHKHKPEAPRLRLIAPLARPVGPEEYEALTRKLAEGIGLQYMDHTTFEPTRLMYWPSVSRDGEYVFAYNDGPCIDPDEILARYPGDWHDISLWPVCPDEARVNKPRSGKIEDPTAKQGLVGVFCRSYTVPEAIAQFLPDVYTPTDQDDRYTYAAGSTSGGLVIYDDGLACYSHHSTDPASGKDLNAFDLVRLHLFGQNDGEEDEGRTITQQQSYKDMLDLVRRDNACIRTMNAERAERTKDDFKAADADEENPDAWKDGLDQTKRGAVEATARNAKLILENDPMIQGIRLNDLRGAVEAREPLPWKRPDIYWSDQDDSQLFMYVALTYEVNFADRILLKAFDKVTSDRRFNPLQDFIRGLPEWDGVPRVDRMLVDYLGAEDGPYTRAVTRKTLCGAMARALEPGCKFDYMLVLDGPEGIGKSSIFRILGGEFFSDALQLTDVRGKEAAEKLQGKWIVEAPELSGRNKVDLETFKGFITTQIDEYRPAYARRVAYRPRTAIIVGTTNSTTGFLRDQTGNRRFWPVEVSGSRRLNVLEMTEETRLQIWAEAKADYELGEPLFLDQELEQVAREKQREQLEVSDHEDDVIEYLNTPIPDDWYSRSPDERQNYFRFDMKPAEDTELMQRTIVTAREICEECMGRSWSTWTRLDSNELKGIMLRIGWQQSRHKRRIPGYYNSPIRVFERVPKGCANVDL